VTALPTQIAFYSLAVLTLASALFVVRARNIVHAGYWLLPCFVGVAGLFGVLEAHFFFVVQLLIYAGAILVLILFALMLTRDVMNPALPQNNHYAVQAATLCGALAIGACYVLTNERWGAATSQPANAADQTRALGESLIGLYAVPFEVASLLLLAALIGAIVLAKSDREPEAALAPLAVVEEPAEDMVVA
jgi:NADH-quinone oxidoreductase subunit J